MNNKLIVAWQKSFTKAQTFFSFSLSGNLWSSIPGLARSVRRKRGPGYVKV